MSLQVVLLGAPTSLASIVVIGPHQHAAVTHVGDSSEVGQREHMVHISAGLSFCVLVTISPRRAKWGGCVPRGMRSVDTPPPTRPAAGAPPAGPWQEPI
jgi:hypothetical protein